MKKNWLDEVLNALQDNPNKKTILIGGASSAGKTYRCKRIKEYLEQNGKKCLMISLDNFYRPLSLRMTDYAVKKMPEIKNQKAKIYDIISDVTRYTVFDEKFSDKSKQQIVSRLDKIFDKDISQKILANIIDFYNNVNFDVPESMDFENIAKQINCKNGKIHLPSYSFVTSEIIPSKEQIFDIKDFDYIIFEGIFALRPEIKNNVDKNKTLTIALQADNMTMFSRRMYRDIIKTKRTRSPQQTFETYFEQILPCFDKYVKNTLNGADIKIDAHLTDEEIVKKTPSQKIMDYSYQITDNDCNNARLYITEKNNKPDNLIFEYSIDKDYYTETYDFKTLLNQDDISKVLSYFQNCGFEVSLNQKNDNCEL